MQLYSAVAAPPAELKIYRPPIMNYLGYSTDKHSKDSLREATESYLMNIVKQKWG
jgi:hypothetical protein